MLVVLWSNSNREPGQCTSSSSTNFWRTMSQFLRSERYDMGRCCWLRASLCWILSDRRRIMSSSAMGDDSRDITWNKKRCHGSIRTLLRELDTCAHHVLPLTRRRLPKWCGSYPCVFFQVILKTCLAAQGNGGSQDAIGSVASSWFSR